MKIIYSIIKRSVLFLTLIFLNGQLFCQKPDPRNSEFVLNLKLTTVTSRDSINQIKELLDSINSLGEKTGGKKNALNFFKKWAFVYCVANGFHEYVPMQYKDITYTQFPNIEAEIEPRFQRKGKTFYLVPKNNVKTLSTHKLFKIFGLSKIKFPVNYLPNVYARRLMF